VESRSGSEQQQILSNAINNNIQIVGQCASTGIFPYRAFLYSDGQMQDLNNLLDLT
jgi:probable HAF family extracellular repeat protein